MGEGGVRGWAPGAMLGEEVKVVVVVVVVVVEGER